MRVRTLALLAVVLAGSACSGVSREPGTPGSNVARLPADVVPSKLLSLDVEREDVSKTIKSLQSTYVRAAGLYSLRSDDVVQATLQIVKLLETSDYRESWFRASMVNRIGSTRPRAVRLGDDTVYLTSGTRQSIAMWFRGPTFLVVNIRQDYPTPRELIRTALEIEP